jgi:hypothetical protein
MPERVTHRVVTFLHAFTLEGVDGELPAGSYGIETIEEPIEGLSFLAYRRVSTTIALSSSGATTHSRQVVTIDPRDLDAAEKQDAGRSTEATHAAEKLR